VIDVLRADRLAGPAEAHLRDDAMGDELADDVVPLRNGVGVGRVGDLEREARQGEAGVPGPGADPVGARRVRRTVGVEPEGRRPERFLALREARRPEADVMTLAWAVADGPSKPMSWPRP
jgi:hypothetical protein